MSCNKCLDTGWLCEKHNDKPQSHPTINCTEAGMPCDCGAFPHKKKPREFWIANVDMKFKYFDSTICNEKPDYKDFEDAVHVVEVVVISEIELSMANDNWYTETVPKLRARKYALGAKDLSDAFEAGARWMKAKLEGKE